MILNAGICANDVDIFKGGNCLSKMFPLFDKCITSNDRYSYLPDPLVFVPFYYSLFAKPSALMIRMLNKIRRRLNLPKLKPGFEPRPGAWGLQTPGYYIFALHFRRIPLGFEPLSVETNNERGLSWRLQILEQFWKTAVGNAEQAASIAACRNQTLLIYFATDNVDHLRSEAVEHLSPFGRVIFGLEPAEVGHVSPQWTQQAIDSMQSAAKTMYKDGKLAVGSQGTISHNQQLQIASSDSNLDAVELAEDGTLVPVDDESYPNLEELMIDVATDPGSTQKHAIMALVEWWILGNANWLQSHVGTSYSDTAAGWGLGPGSVMERMDIVQGENHVQSIHRRDWTRNVCQPVGAADPAFAQTCPNHKKKI